jgi:hypothetical protein
MPRTERECAAMAAAMLDTELFDMVRKIDDKGKLTPLQAAAIIEWVQRQEPLKNRA